MITSNTMDVMLIIFSMVITLIAAALTVPAGLECRCVAKPERANLQISYVVRSVAFQIDMSQMACQLLPASAKSTIAGSKAITGIHYGL